MLALLLGLAAAASAQVNGKPVATLIDVDACWSRPANADADRLGLPARFCVSRVGISSPYPGELPFHYEDHMIVEGTPVNRDDVFLGGGANYKTYWNLTGNLWDGKQKKPKCGTLTHAFAAIYVDVDLQGRPMAGHAIEVRGFMIDSDIFCRNKAKDVDFLYAREPAR